MWECVGVRGRRRGPAGLLVQAVQGDKTPKAHPLDHSPGSARLTAHHRVCSRLSWVWRAGLQRTEANPRASVFHRLTLFLFVLPESRGASTAGSMTGAQSARAADGVPTWAGRQPAARGAALKSS